MVPIPRPGPMYNKLLIFNYSCPVW
jgi:hypothetical protein